MSSPLAPPPRDRASPGPSRGTRSAWSVFWLVAAAVGIGGQGPVRADGLVEIDSDQLVIEESGDRVVIEELGGGRGIMRARGRWMFGVPPDAEQRLDFDLPGEADGPMPDDPEKAAAWQQRQQILQHAAQMAQFFQPVLHAELELVRSACGDDALPAETRKLLLRAGRDAVKESAVAFAKAQMNGNGEQLDAWKTIRDAIARAVKAHVPAEPQAAYQRQVALRAARHERAGRNRIVSMLHSQLELTPDQQARIADDLEMNWDAGWPWMSDFRGVQFNGYRPAPDYADACIAPHLDERQRAAWNKWCKEAGVKAHGIENWVSSLRRNFNGQGLEADAWWSK
ncbi:MAG: hypothetical protein ACK6CT_09985 [Planctomycetia bacterium]|jgi:hypothetical protein